MKQETKVNFLQIINEEQPIADDDPTQSIEENDAVAFAEFTSQNGWKKLKEIRIPRWQSLKYSKSKRQRNSMKKT